MPSRHRSRLTCRFSASVGDTYFRGYVRLFVTRRRPGYFYYTGAYTALNEYCRFVTHLEPCSTRKRF